MCFQIFFACLVAFVFSGCNTIAPVERLAKTELYDLWTLSSRKSSTGLQIQTLKSGMYLGLAQLK